MKLLNPWPPTGLRDLLLRSGWMFFVPRVVVRTMLRLFWSVNTLRWRLVVPMGSSVVIKSRVRIERPRLVRLGHGTEIANDVVITSESVDGVFETQDGVQINAGCHLDHSGGLLLRSYVLVSEQVMVYTHSHGVDPRSVPRAGPLEIDSGAWIGARAMIMAGVRRIGAHAIVAAGAVVTGDVADGEVVAGVPARVVRRRSDPK